MIATGLFEILALSRVLQAVIGALVSTSSVALRTTTAIAAPSSGSDRRCRYASAAGLQSELQQRRTAASASASRSLAR